MKKIVIALLVLVAAVGAFAQAQQPWAQSWNQKGHLNGYVSGGVWIGGVEASAAAELILGQFNAGGIPLDWGVEGRALMGMDIWGGFGGLTWAVGPLATLHLGLSSGFDFYTALGLGLYGQTWAGGYPIRLGFASFGGGSYKLSKNLFVLFEGGYIGWTWASGVGLVLKM